MVYIFSTYFKLLKFLVNFYFNYYRFYLKTMLVIKNYGIVFKEIMFFYDDIIDLFMKNFMY